ncbi:MAG TPA: hypothetical protein VLE97_05680 [Gaiellaceae bacterium]|nr:hypothetical protein [Gaiellaceae bacterium]
MKIRPKCIECSCEDFLRVRSEVLPDTPVTLMQCEECGKQYSTVRSWQIAAAAIRVTLGRDKHLASCEVARDGGPNATLACARCGRAKWMHATRHDTCAQFCWVTEQSLTEQQIGLLGTIPDLPERIRLACSRALNDYGLAPYYVREARQACAAAINSAKREESDARRAESEHRA